MQIHLTSIALLVSAATAFADPQISSWHTENSGRYARIYETTADETAGNAVTTWTRGQGIQSQPTYAGVSEVAASTNWVYIRSTGLASHVMGPWYLNAAKTNLFPNYPSNRAVLYRIPRVPVIPATKVSTGLGTIGRMVNGVSIFDNRDAFSYVNASGTDATPQNGLTGDAIWNREAYHNESVTFDAALAHQAGPNYHYHAQPIGVRYLLGDHVDYNPTTNRYTESATPVTKHSPILGWAADGLPVYGPYGYSNPTDPGSGARRMISGYVLRDGGNGTTAISVREVLPLWAQRVQNKPTLNANQYGPPVNATYLLGHYIEDFDYRGDLGHTLGVDFDLNEQNVRFCHTPEFPAGTYAYFVTIDAAGTPVFPYITGRQFFGTPSGGAVGSITETVTKHFEGGPEKPDAEGGVEVAAGTGDVTLKWSGVEGSHYEVDYSPNLLLWKSSSAMVADTDEPAMVDSGLAASQDKQFYRMRRVGMNAFDAAGFDYTPQTYPTLTTITVDITGGTAAPAALGEDPLSATFNGQAVIFVGRPAQNQVQLRLDVSALTDGDYPVSVTFDGASGTHTGTYTVGGGGPVTSGNNVLLIIVDDWAIDWSPIDRTPAQALADGVTLPNMPTLQSLAASGLRFTQAYAQPVCSPTRATIITGRHPFRHGVGNPTANSTLPESELTLPEIFKAQSSPYGLASFGKWHLGGGNTGPSTIGGWDYFKGILNGGVQDYSSWQKTEVIGGVATVTNNFTTYTTTDQVNEAVSWISTQNTASKPWLCWLALNAPHTPFHEPPAGLAPAGGYTNPSDVSNTGLYRRMLEAMDTEIGRLLQSVDLNKTNVILIGDNGSPAQVAQAPFGSGHAKDDLYQGGVHVPLVISGPDVTVAPGATTDKLAHCVDLFSTMLQLCGIDPAAATSAVDAIDSKTLVPILKGTDSLDRCVVVEKFGDGNGEGRALISDDYPDYKLIIFGERLSTTDTPSLEFYNITNDINEQAPLSIAGLTGTALAAYNHLIAKDAALGGGYSDPPSVALDTLYIQLPATGVTPPVPNLTNPTGGAISVNSVTVNGAPATFVARVNSGADLSNESDDVADAFWVKVTITPSGPYTTAHVVFPNTPMGAAREYDSINTILVKP